MSVSLPQVNCDNALSCARETRELKIGAGVLGQIADIIAAHFPGKTVIPVADTATLPYAQRVSAILKDANLPAFDPIVLTDPDLYAEYRFVEEVEAALAKVDAIPIAVGSGTINDLVKLASHRLGRVYLCVATAASMDGYTAFGASITYRGSKQTFSCPAPFAVVADIDIIREAPPEMGASGYADLLSKVTAGADWILADALGEEAIEPTAWNVVQQGLRKALSDPAGVQRRDPAALQLLTEGLMLGGFAMQSHKSSRPASGAEHQFSHLWDMQHHTHNGVAPSHGFKVGIATLAVTALYEELLRLPLKDLDIERIITGKPSSSQEEALIRALFPQEDLLAVASQESAVKFVSPEALRSQIECLRRVWVEACERIRAQLVPFDVLRKMLEDAGAPTDPEMIGISRDQLRTSFTLASFIRRRFTVLDLAKRTDVLELCLDSIFGPNGKLQGEGVSSPRLITA